MRVDQRAARLVQIGLLAGDFLGIAFGLRLGQLLLSLCDFFRRLLNVAFTVGGQRGVRAVRLRGAQGLLQAGNLMLPALRHVFAASPQRG